MTKSYRRRNPSLNYILGASDAKFLQVDSLVDGGSVLTQQFEHCCFKFLRIVLIAHVSNDFESPPWNGLDKKGADAPLEGGEGSLKNFAVPRRDALDDTKR